MVTKNKTLKTSLFIFLMFQMTATLGVAEEKIVSSLIVNLQQGRLVLQAQGTPLWKILDAIRRECMVEILGLDDRKNEPVTFSSKGETLEDALKQLLRHLGEKNYAFEFVDERLRRASVFPEAEGIVDLPHVPPGEKVSQKKFVNVVIIQNIVDGSQAQALDLLEGDLIIEYDGVKITGGPLDLIKEVKKKSNKEQVGMIIVRNNEPRRFVLNGGAIGVRIKTIKIPREELDNYLSEE